MKRALLSLKYRFAMSTAYLMQQYAPDHTKQWLREADKALLEMWRLERGL